MTPPAYFTKNATRTYQLLPADVKCYLDKVLMWIQNKPSIIKESIVPINGQYRVRLIKGHYMMISFDMGCVRVDEIK